MDDHDDLVVLPGAFDRPHRADTAPAEPVTPRDATSVVLVRDVAGPGSGIEVFLLHRVAEMAFAGGMTVFPGGGTSPGDRKPLATAGPGAAEWARRWDDSEESATALLATAVRETFEETGVLPAGPAPGGPGTTAASAVSTAGGSAGAGSSAGSTAVADPTAHTADRAALTDGSTDLADVLAAADLVVRDDLLGPWARWITPPGMPRRYDTRFFLAVLPTGQEADGRTTEAQAAGWSTPAEALAAFERGERRLMPVTWAVLRDLDAIGAGGGTAALVAEAARRRPRPVIPAFVDGGDVLHLALPPHAGTFLTGPDRTATPATTPGGPR